MVIVIIPRCDQASHNYHSEGGLAIVAESEDAALTLANATPHVKVEPAEWEKRVTYRLAEDLAVPNVFVFPDAGCC